ARLAAPPHWVRNSKRRGESREPEAMGGGSVTDAHEACIGIFARKARSRLQQVGMILHRIEPGGTTDDEVFVGEAPRNAHRTTGVRITPHRIGIDAVHDDRPAIPPQPTLHRLPSPL